MIGKAKVPFWNPQLPSFPKSWLTCTCPMANLPVDEMQPPQLHLPLDASLQGQKLCKTKSHLQLVNLQNVFSKTCLAWER